MLTLAIVCLPTLFNLGYRLGRRDGETAATKATELKVDHLFNPWLLSDQSWRTLRERMLYEHVRPSKLDSLQPDSSALEQRLTRALEEARTD